MSYPFRVLDKPSDLSISCLTIGITWCFPTVLLSEIDKMMKEEAKSLHEAIDVLHLKHKEYAEDIQIYVRSHSEDASEIKRLEGF